MEQEEVVGGRSALRLLFGYLSPAQLPSVRLVCRAWQHEMCLWAEETLVLPVQVLCHSIMSVTRRLQGDSKGKARSRFEFLEATLVLINRWELPILPHVPIWRHLCVGLCGLLHETEQVLELVGQNAFKVNETFDVFELSLRRYYQNIEALHVIKGCKSSPLNLLVLDPGARFAWKSHFGELVLHVSWTDFWHAFFPQSSQRIVKAVKFLVNFPADNLVTLYKFDLLCRHFGPFSELERNIDVYALGPGFVGLVNRIYAKKVSILSFWFPSH